ncbi:uncharacterized protein DAT39_022506, partial [Clarias magur]
TGQGKRPGKISSRCACDHLVKFIKTGTSIQGHLDSIGESLQPYLLAVGPKKSNQRAQRGRYLRDSKRIST